MILLLLYEPNLPPDHLWSVICGLAALLVAIVGYLAKTVLDGDKEIPLLRAEVAELKKDKASPEDPGSAERFKKLEANLADTKNQLADAQVQLQELVTFVQACAPLLVNRRRNGGGNGI